MPYVLRPHHQEHVAGISQRKQSHRDQNHVIGGRKTAYANHRSGIGLLRVTFRIRAARRPAFRLADPEQSDQHAQCARHRGGPKHSSHAKSREQHQRSQRPGDRPRGIHRLNQTVGRPQPLLRHRLRDHHIARGSAHSFGQPVAEPDQQNVPPRRHDGEQRLHRVRDKVSRHYKRLAAVDAVGEISRKKLGERCNALRNPFNQAQLRRPRSQRNQKRRQAPNTPSPRRCRSGRK